ncbi:MAG: hypothetical protein TU36_008225 [Vulcanisaeta sp. AZ3]
MHLRDLNIENLASLISETIFELLPGISKRYYRRLVFESVGDVGV